MSENNTPENKIAEETTAQISTKQTQKKSTLLKISRYLAIILIFFSISIFTFRYYTVKDQKTLVDMTVFHPTESTDEVVIKYKGAVAEIEDVITGAAQKIKTTPYVPGKWYWRDTKTLVFQPKEKWSEEYQEIKANISNANFNNIRYPLQQEITFKAPGFIASLKKKNIVISAQNNLFGLIQFEFSAPVAQPEFLKALTIKDAHEESVKFHVTENIDNKTYQVTTYILTDEIEFPLSIELSALRSIKGSELKNSIKEKLNNPDQKQKKHLFNVYETPSSQIINGTIVPEPQEFYVYDNSAKSHLIGKELNQSVKIFPEIAGKWSWKNNREIIFMPKEDWAPDTQYTVNFSRDLFEKESSKYESDIGFSTPKFTASFSELNFLSDEKDPTIKRVTGKISFTYPVDLAYLKKALSAETLNKSNYQINVIPVVGSAEREFDLITEPLTLEEEEDVLHFYLSNAKASYNNAKTSSAQSDSILLPSRSSFFQVKDVYSSIFSDPQNDDEAKQILSVEFSSPAVRNDVLKYISLYDYQGSCYSFNKDFQEKQDEESNFSLSENVSAIKNLKKIPFQFLENEEDVNKKELFLVYTSKENCVIAEIKQGLTSVDGFSLNETVVKSTSVKTVPKKLNFAFDGALMPLNTKAVLPITSRGIKEITAKVALIPYQSIHHLVSQTYGDFKNPSFWSSFNEENLGEMFELNIPLNAIDSSKNNYATLNLKPYLKDKRGLFLIKVQGDSLTDKRLLLLTNIALIVKDNADFSHTVIVTDYLKEKPVSGAKVEVLGKNGLPILKTKTDSDGFAFLPDFSTFKREKQPVAYLVTKGDDISFMPIGRNDRLLNYSRFDVSGERIASNSNELKAIAFSDRGVYRPGETVRLGIAVKDSSFRTPVNNQIQITVKDPRQNLVFEQEMNVLDGGLQDISFEINPIAVTGDYSVVMTTPVDENLYKPIGQTTFKVEEFVPDTLRIKTDFETTPKGWFDGNRLNANVMLENLYGIPAAGHTVRAEMEIEPAVFVFAKFKGFKFDYPLRDERKHQMSMQEKLNSQTTGDNGQSSFSLNLEPYAKGNYRLHFIAEGAEAVGGRSVRTLSSILISQHKILLGIKTNEKLDYLKKDSAPVVEFLAINNGLNPIALPDTKAVLYEKKYVSTLVKQPNGMFQYQSVQKVEKVRETSLELKDSALPFTLDTAKSGNYRLDIMDKSDSVLASVSYTVAGERNTENSIERSAELDLKLSKSEYKKGEEIKVQITAPYEGFGLITIERDKVYAQKWFKTTTKTSEQTIELPSELEGNAYINVAFVRSTQSDQIYTSPLAFAVAPFEINKDNRKQNVTLNVVESVKPGDVLTIKYKSSEKGKIILYGVNEGILSYAKYKTPDILALIMPKLALQVQTSQTLNLILPRFIERFSSTGGDSPEETALSRNINPFARKMDKPVAFWSGVLDVNQKEQTFMYTVPDNFNGKIRVMAIALNNETFGSSQKETIVRGDFSMTPSAPFNVVPGDVFEVGTSLVNTAENSNELSGILSLETSDKFEIIGPTEHKFTLKEGQGKPFVFKMKAKDSLGSSEIKLKAVSGPYSTQMTVPIGIRPSSAYMTDLIYGKGHQQIVLKDFYIDMYDEYRDTEFLISTSPLMMTRGLVKYLEKYPYGCTEQAISRAFPMLVLLHKNPKITKDIDIYKMFDTTVNILKERQHSSGGFKLWTSAWGEPDDFATVYAYHFLTYAKERGFDVPKSLLNKATSYVKLVAANNNDEEISAYAAYLLTVNGVVTTNYLINLEKSLQDKWVDDQWKSTLAASYLAASYQLLKNEDKANEIVGHFEESFSHKYFFNYYSRSSFLQNLYLMAQHFPAEFEKIRIEGLETVLQQMEDKRFTSITSAYGILALTSFPSSPKDDKEIEISGGTPSYTDEYVSVDISKLRSNDQLIIKSEKPFFYSIKQQGYAKKRPDEKQGNGFTLMKKIINAEGEEIETAKLGDEIKIQLSFDNQNYTSIDNLAVVDLIPGCFEIVPSSVLANGLKSSELREDRAIFHFSLGRGNEISYKVKVIAKGEFTVPSTMATDLYEPELSANTKETTISVHE